MSNNQYNSENSRDVYIKGRNIKEDLYNILNIIINSMVHVAENFIYLLLLFGSLGYLSIYVVQKSKISSVEIINFNEHGAVISNFFISIFFRVAKSILK